MINRYEVLPTIAQEATGFDNITLRAQNTASNGIRIYITEERYEEDEIVDAAFDFTDQQAFDIGTALVRWSGL